MGENSIPGGGPGDSRIFFRVRSDAALLRRAIRQGWPVPQAVRDAVIDELLSVIRSDKVSTRLRLAALGLIVDADAADVRDKASAVAARCCVTYQT
jgi:hypothetical protein